MTKSCANTVYINLLITDEPGKQVSSAIKIKNVSRSHVAFKFQTTAPKSCFMRPPSGVLPPNGSIIATGLPQECACQTWGVGLQRKFSMELLSKYSCTFCFAIFK
jgi:hypothetical protein